MLLQNTVLPGPPALSGDGEYPRNIMASLLPEGSVHKAIVTATGFANNRPSPRRLWANRTQRFDRLHAIAPSTVEPGETVSLTLQARDQCERLCSEFQGEFRVESTDDEATHPSRVTFLPRNGGVATVPDVEFETPGTQYLTFVREETSERFVSNPVRVVESTECTGVTSTSTRSSPTGVVASPTASGLAGT